MKWITFSIFFIVPALLCAGPVSAMQSANFKITSSVMSGGGGTMTSASFSSHSVLGQPSPIMEQGMQPMSAGYSLYPGYIYTLVSNTFCPWDLSSPMDGDVDGQDLFKFIDDGHDTTLFLEEFSGEYGRDDCF